MRFRLIHLLAAVTSCCVLLGIGTGFGWQVAVASFGYAMLAVALFSFAVRPALALFTIWLAFLSSLGIPATGFTLVVSNVDPDTNVIYGWQAGYVAAWLTMAIFTDPLPGLRFLAITLANLLLLALPIRLVFPFPRRKAVAWISTIGGLLAWSLLIDGEPLYLGFYLWAFTISIFTFVFWQPRARLR